MGAAIAKLGWERHSYVISTKLYWGIHDVPNMQNTLNRKYLTQAIDGSLERLGLDFVDLLFCHRADPNTPIEETVWAMSDIVSSGKALYWGTSEWTADEIRAAWDIADKHNLHKPVMEQPQYNLLARGRVEFEYLRLYDDIGLGLTIWSPLASGVLTGKYLDGIPEGSRGALPGYEWLQHSMNNERTKAKVRALKADLRRSRLHARAVVVGLVREEPARVHRDHRRESRRPGPREPRRARRDRPARRAHDGTHRRSASRVSLTSLA